MTSFSALPRAFFLVTALRGVVAACAGSAATQPDVATLATAAPAQVAATATPTTDEDGQQAFLDFAACMRTEGIDFPDPVFGSDGRVQIGRGGPGLAGVDLQGSEFQAAQEACGDLLQGLGDQFDAEQQAELQDSLVEFAGCMRDEGIDMPDPQLGGGRGLAVLGGPDSGVDTGSPEYQDAMEQCGDLLGALPVPGAQDGE